MVTAPPHPAPVRTGRPARLAGAPPGPRKPGQRQAVLLDAAAALFVEKGVSATSIDDIVLRAGVAKGTFYHYFQDRSAMLEALRRRYSQQLADAAREATEACAPQAWSAKLEAWVEAAVCRYLASYALHDAIFHDPVVCQRCVMSEEPVVRDLAILLESGIDAQVWETEDALSTAVCMFHAVHGLIDEAIALEGDTDCVAPKLARLFANMLRPA